MALIKCKECGHEISDKASVCPNCGCPLDGVGYAQEEVLEEKPKKTKGWIWVLAVALLCLIGGGGYYAYAKFHNDGNSEVTLTEQSSNLVELTPDFISAIQKYEKLGSFNEGLAPVMRDGKWGFINTKGEEVIPCQFPNPDDYYTASSFYEGMALIKKDGKWGFINNKGEEVIPVSIVAEAVGRFSEGMAFVYIDEENFSVINKEGKTVFKGKADFSWYLGPNVANELLPVYSHGNICVPLELDKFAVYDKQGHKIKEINQESRDKLDNQDETKPYKIFIKENGDDEYNQYFTVGLKTANGTEIIPAIYDKIGNIGAEEKIDVPNGVVLVILYEIGEDAIEGYGGELDSPNTKRHYGYADLKGNDTFSDELKQKCKKSKEQAMQKIKQQEEMLTGPDNDEWLQGRWIGTTASGYSLEVIIEGGIFTEKINGKITYSGSYDFNGDMLIYDNANAFWPVDKDNKVLTYDGSPMRKESAGASTNSSSSYNNAGNSNQNEEMRIMSRLHELGKKGQTLVSELSAMRQRGQMDPARYLYIKQTLIQYKDEQIRLSRELDDEQMTREYMQQKDGVLQSFRMIENGY